MCQHKWYEINREWYDGNRSIAWCELCGELKFTNYYQGEKPDIIFRTPKSSKVANDSASDNTQMDAIALCIRKWIDEQGLYTIDDTMVSLLTVRLVEIAQQHH